LLRASLLYSLLSGALLLTSACHPQVGHHRHSYRLPSSHNNGRRMGNVSVAKQAGHELTGRITNNAIATTASTRMSTRPTNVATNTIPMNQKNN
jgi:hypothetical protein